MHLAAQWTTTIVIHNKVHTLVLTSNFFSSHCSLCSKCGSEAILATSYARAQPGPAALSSTAEALKLPTSMPYLPGPNSLFCREKHEHMS